MNEPDSRQPVDDSAGTWTWSLPPDQAPGGPDHGIGVPESHAWQEGWRREGALPDAAGAWGMPPDYGPPPGWPGQHTYMPGAEEDSTWDDRYQSAPPMPHAHRKPRRISGRPLAAAALLAVVAAVSVVVFPRTGVLRMSAASNPGAQPSQRGLRVTTRAGHAATSKPRSPAAPPPAITRTAAERVLNHYWQVNNEANELRSDALLSTIEAGTSYRMDIGGYRWGRVADPGNHGYVPFRPVHAVFYIPRQPAGVYPRWFVAAVTYADLTRPQHPTGSGYLLFSQTSPGTAWKDTLEPNELPDSGPPVHVALDANGYATAVSPGTDAARLDIAPEQLGQVTAAPLDGTVSAIKPPGNLVDLQDQAFWRSRLPAESTDRDAHQAVPGSVFGLRTRDGGAVLFCSVTAELTLAPPPGETFELQIPGYYSPSETLTSARMGYIEQFAAYDPPKGQINAHLVADVSGIASRG
jgi:hypothetical protein